jgi:hypothetical protein
LPRKPFVFFSLPVPVAGFEPFIMGQVLCHLATGALSRDFDNVTMCNISSITIPDINDVCFFSIDNNSHVIRIGFEAVWPLELGIPVNKSEYLQKLITPLGDGSGPYFQILSWTGKDCQGKAH